jgi:small subunit ribosomal protein S5
MRQEHPDWQPKTRLGRMVLRGDISNMRDALESGLPLKEPEIVDILLPGLSDEVLDVNMVQRMTDSGRRVNFVITAVVGNQDGYVGLGKTKGKEVGPAIRKTIDAAKLNIIEVKRGCGSWECGCRRAHSLPFQVKGKSGSVEVGLKPAPRGISLAVGGIAKSILRLAGIKDAWGFTKGHSRTTVNYASATFNALRQTGSMKTRSEQAKDLCIISGPAEIRAEADILEASQTEEPEEEKPGAQDKPETNGKTEKAEEKSK